VGYRTNEFGKLWSNQVAPVRGRSDHAVSRYDL